MAVCTHCNGEMTEKISCKPDAIIIGGDLFEPIRWGEERAGRALVVDVCCGDCGTPPGGVHHPGCCLEQCPGCFGQALGCLCSDDSDDDDDGETPDEWTIARRPARHPMRCRTLRLRRPYRL